MEDKEEAYSPWAWAVGDPYAPGGPLAEIHPESPIGSGVAHSDWAN